MMTLTIGAGPAAHWNELLILNIPQLELVPMLASEAREDRLPLYRLERDHLVAARRQPLDDLGRHLQRAARSRCFGDAERILMQQDDASCDPLVVDQLKHTPIDLSIGGGGVRETAELIVLSRDRPTRDLAIGIPFAKRAVDARMIAPAAMRQTHEIRRWGRPETGQKTLGLLQFSHDFAKCQLSKSTMCVSVRVDSMSACHHLLDGAWIRLNSLSQNKKSRYCTVRRQHVQ